MVMIVLSGGVDFHIPPLRQDKPKLLLELIILSINEYLHSHSDLDLNKYLDKGERAYVQIKKPIEDLHPKEKLTLENMLDVLPEYLHKEGRTYIRSKKFAEDLDPEKMTQLLDIYKSLKRKVVELLIDCIAHPEKEEYQVQHEDRQISLKDLFEIEIKKNVEMWK